MINYPNKSNRFSTPEEIQEFVEWSREQIEPFESIYNQLGELAYQLHECDPSKPYWVHLETLLNGFGDCLLAGKDLDDQN